MVYACAAIESREGEIRSSPAERQERAVCLHSNSLLTVNTQPGSLPPKAKMSSV